MHNAWDASDACGAPGAGDARDARDAFDPLGAGGASALVDGFRLIVDGSGKMKLGKGEA